MVARRAVELRTGIAGVALDVLPALRTGEFEFSHNVFGFGQNTTRPLLVGDEAANSFLRKIASKTALGKFGS